jgi:DNA-directed RNA polymerase alpha subunit
VPVRLGGYEHELSEMFHPFIVLLMPHPMPMLPDDAPICKIDFPTRIRNALYYAGMKTVGEVRESSDEMLRSLPDLGAKSVAILRETLGSPSRDSARAAG